MGKDSGKRVTRKRVADVSAAEREDAEQLERATTRRLARLEKDLAAARRTEERRRSRLAAASAEADRIRSEIGGLVRHASDPAFGGARKVGHAAGDLIEGAADAVVDAAGAVRDAAGSVVGAARRAVRPKKKAAETALAPAAPAPDASLIPATPVSAEAPAPTKRASGSAPARAKGTSDAAPARAKGTSDAAPARARRTTAAAKSRETGRRASEEGPIVDTAQHGTGQRLTSRPGRSTARPAPPSTSVPTRRTCWLARWTAIASSRSSTSRTCSASGRSSMPVG